MQPIFMFDQRPVPLSKWNFAGGGGGEGGHTGDVLKIIRCGTVSSGPFRHCYLTNCILICVSSNICSSCINTRTLLFSVDVVLGIL